MELVIWQPACVYSHYIALLTTRLGKIASCSWWGKAMLNAVGMLVCTCRSSGFLSLADSFYYAHQYSTPECGCTATAIPGSRIKVPSQRPMLRENPMRCTHG